MRRRGNFPRRLCLNRRRASGDDDRGRSVSPGPGRSGRRVCFTDESHWDGLLEYPQYSRPEVWHGLAVPEVLLSGNHQNVDRWRKKQSILRTMYRRPDMFKKLRFPYKTRAERKFVAELEAENEDFRNRDPKNLDYRK